MLGEQLHAGLHDATIVKVIDRPDHSLEDQEETLQLLFL